MRTWITFVHLMDESERSLWRTDAQPDYYRAPVFHVLDDGRRYRRWEMVHARLMRRVADAWRRAQQILVLRRTAVQLIHRRALVDYVRTSGVRGVMRDELIGLFYGPTDAREALLREHRQYVVAAASGYCTEVLVDAVQDAGGSRMLARYQDLYCEYFGLFGQFIAATIAGDIDAVAILRPTMLEYRVRASLLRQLVLSAPPRAAVFGRSATGTQSARFADAA